MYFKDVSKSELFYETSIRVKVQEDVCGFINNVKKEFEWLGLGLG